MKPNIKTTVQKSLILTPQLRQAIYLSQLSRVELADEIHHVLLENPLLELEHDSSQDEVSLESPELLTADVSHTGSIDVTKPTIFDVKDKHNDYLKGQLQQQLLLFHLQDHEHALAMALIDYLDEDGYLSLPVNQLLTTLKKDFPELDKRTLQDTRELIFQCDPGGLGCENLQEYLIWQLKRDKRNNPIVNKLINDHLDILAKHDFVKLRKALKCNKAELEEAVALVQSLQPRPNMSFFNQAPTYLYPELRVFKYKGHWQVGFLNDISQNLKLNQEYADIIKSMGKKPELSPLKEHLHDARSFLLGLAHRQKTLLQVASYIVDFQQAYFDEGEKALKPLTMRDMATDLHLHESTISRILHDKYVLSPTGTLALKFFISHHLPQANHNDHCPTEVKALIKSLIADEPCDKPLSDKRICEHLAEEYDIFIARRTVAKYRLAMDIPPSSQRKSLSRIAK